MPKAAPNSPRILLWDIETSHMLAAVFGTRDQDISHGNILQDWYIICASWKFLGDKKTSAISVLDDEKRFKKDAHDDYVVVKKLHEVLQQADIIVAHNGDAFDLKKFNARAIKHNLPPLPRIQSVDTLKVARREFKFTSNRLDYIGHYLGFGGKMSTPPGMWLQALDGDEKAINAMVKYNKVDVELLEKVYEKLKPWMKNHPNVNQFNDGTKHEEGCPCCTSTEYKKNGTRNLKSGKFQMFVCSDCGSNFQRQMEKRETKLTFKPA